jgi:hypothetical protein
MRRIFASVQVKTIIPVLAASVAFTGCAKDELLHIDYDNSYDSEITFQVAPVTKATTSTFGSTSVFETNAYYHTSDSQWVTSAGECEEYIPENTVSWDEGAWRTEESYHWPEADGKLTFYCWTMNRDNLDFHPQSSARVSIDPLRGVCLSDFDITLDSDLDFMVAAAAQNLSRKSNGLRSSAVTTRFEHQLSRIRVNARTSADYTGSKEFHITSILMKNVAKEADYQQSSCEDGTWSEIHRWTVSETEDAVYGNYSSQPQRITSERTVLPGEREMYIPQTFTDGVEYLQVTYTIHDLYSGIVEEVTEDIPLGKLISGDGLRNGKLYTINVSIGLDEVFWDPSVGDWDVEK